MDEGIIMDAKRTIRSGFLLVAVAVAVMGVTILVHAGGTADTVSVALKWLPQAQFAGYYVAREKGFYQDENLVVEIVPGGSSVEPQDLVADGSVEFGVTWLGILLKARDRGVPLVNIAQVFQSSGFRYLTWSDSGIESPSDLRGRVLEVWYGGNEVPLLALLQKYGIDANTDVTLQSQAFDMNAFLQRTVDASAAMSYNELNTVRESIVAEALQLGMDELRNSTLDSYEAAVALVQPDAQLRMFDVNAEGVAMLEDMIFTSASYLESEAHRDIAARFVRASLRGWTYARDHRDEAVNILLAQDTAGTMSRLHEALMLDAVVDLIWEAETPLGYLEPSLFEQTAAIALEFGVIENPASSDAYTHAIWERATSVAD
jgi:NitT/TauT family transport system substrate-binding protein